MPRAGGSRTRASSSSSPGSPISLTALRAKGHDARIADVQHAFGVGQMILRHGAALIGGSDGAATGTPPACSGEAQPPVRRHGEACPRCPQARL